MNLKKIEKSLSELLNKKMNLDFTYKTEEDILLANVSLNLYGRENPVTCNLWIFEGGSMIMSFLFGKVPYTVQVLNAASSFNSEVTFFKATIMSGVLNILHEVYVVDEKMVAEYVKGMLGILTSDDVKVHLEALLQVCDAAV